jgi:hypothetical protein
MSRGFEKCKIEEDDRVAPKDRRITLTISFKEKKK